MCRVQGHGKKTRIVNVVGVESGYVVSKNPPLHVVYLVRHSTARYPRC